VDEELDLLKMRKLLELKRRILAAQGRSQRQPQIDPLELVRSRLVNRGDEVLEQALRLYPRATRRVVEELARLIRSGRIDRIDGAALLELFENLGMPVRLDTKIVYKAKGKTKTLSELLREKE